MYSQILIAAVGALAIGAHSAPSTTATRTQSRDTAQDYYLKTQLNNSASPFDNLYFTLNNTGGEGPFPAGTVYDIAFQPDITKAARGYMNGTQQAFHVAGSSTTWSLGSSEFQGPDPSVPATANVFADGTTYQFPLNVTSTADGQLMWYGSNKWLVCSRFGDTSSLPPTLQLPNSGPYGGDCELANLVKVKVQ